MHDIPEGPPTAATLVATYETARGPRVILTRRPANLRRHPGQIAFPGGMIEESDPSPLAAATREAWEEIRLRVPDDVGATPLTPVTTITGGIVIQPFWVQLPSSPLLERSPEEVEAILRVPLRDLLVPGALRSIPHPRRVAERTMAYAWRDEVIWGATASSLREVLDLVVDRRMTAAVSAASR